MISIVMPAHNEEGRIGKTLEDYGSFFKEKKVKGEIKDFEIIVVINNTRDKTQEIVKKRSKKYPEIKSFNFEQGGKGFAIIEGFKEALRGSAELIGFVDADEATPPQAFYDLIENVKDYDGIIADRWHKKSKILPKQSLFRRFISRGYNLVVRTLFLMPYRDTQCGCKLFKRKVLEENCKKLVTSNWGFDIALLYCLRKESSARVRSIPTIWRDEKGSRVNLKKTPIRMFASAVRLRLIHSPLKDFVRLYRNLPEKWKFHQV
jgi:glycosyltransferase involved in cell wall biosynthesis